MADVKKQALTKLKTLRPGQMLMAIAGADDQKAMAWLTKNIGDIVKNAVTSGKTKVKDISSALKSLDKKDHADETGVDWDSLEIDTSAMSFGGLLLGKDSAEKIKAMEASLGKAIDKAKAKKDKVEAKNSEQKEGK